ncbi:copper radical oxidase [Fistulina hepatica ATCC 64428]|uniref:Copper radical oxidase n=1 Tax=Fistulina hepatica ATCC 64428 TaxID=1128425 RepID=A0A0D7A1D0_9AGAR|nr:copper radical oxidase [Fistulina hepatica ATCC 64428]
MTVASILTGILASTAVFLTVDALDTHHISYVLPHRRQSIPVDLPGNWTSEGCYTDSTTARTLTGSSYSSTDNMTVENCIDYCDTQDYIYAGVEYSQECYCGNYIENSATATSSGCSMACSGNPSELCGGGSRLDLFYSGGTASPAPIIVPSIGNWTSLGCYNDSVGARALSVGIDITGSVTIETCTAASLVAVQLIESDEIPFKTEIVNVTVALLWKTIPQNNPPTVVTCSEYCGGPDRINIYNYTGTNLPEAGGGGSGGGDVSLYHGNPPAPWTYAGCYIDNAYGRVLPTSITPSENMTVDLCVADCAAQNFTLIGVEYSTECCAYFLRCPDSASVDHNAYQSPDCGNYLVDAAAMTTDSTCDMACGGNATEACGGPDRISVYTATGNVTIYPVPTAQNTSLPGEWVYQGCLREPGADRVFPYQIINTDNNTADACLNQCAAYGYPAAGMEYSDECWCGDISDVMANGGVMGMESECTMACSGDPIHLCGGPQRLQLYYWNGDMNVWNAPENIGYYEFFVPGIIVPLIATVGINNKVTFLEKYGTSLYPNSTGAYELDPTLHNNFSAAWRTMHVQTDVFCSGSVILPDKAGRQINVGGWSLESTFGVRLYTPNGVPGVNSTNDWEENYEELSLQNGRWYPTASVLSNGSILVIGGEDGSNGAPIPTLEILPRIEGGNTTVYLEWLERTDPNNLYPFVFTLPSGNLFIGYYNEARILNATTFDTIKQLPNMPASVNDFLGGRTYPMAGSAGSFPQSAPYTDEFTILLCGGSNPGAGMSFYLLYHPPQCIITCPLGIAIDNCISIQPEAENATWTIERMPSQRVMSCVVTLADGTFMILNGAHQGFAGFGLASDPNLNAIIYDSTLPVGQRMSTLNSTIVARLYHSEAILLPDGRVLISGSDPQTYYPNGTEVYPEEFRIEVYVPPYLNSGLLQPEFNITDTDWDYGGTYPITVKLYQGTASDVKISLIAATSSTHGNLMGSRTIFPEYSCSGNTCNIVAPPNSYISPPGWFQLFVLDGPTPSHSQWVRIGGDPAQLGLWPDAEGFTLPGM